MIADGTSPVTGASEGGTVASSGALRLGRSEFTTLGSGAAT